MVRLWEVTARDRRTRRAVSCSASATCSTTENWVGERRSRGIRSPTHATTGCTNCPRRRANSTLRSRRCGIWPRRWSVCGGRSTRSEPWGVDNMTPAYTHLFYTTAMCDGEDRTTSLELLLQVGRRVRGTSGRRALAPSRSVNSLARLRHGIDVLELHLARDAAAFAATEEAVAPGFDVADRLGPPPVRDVRQRGGALDRHRGGRRSLPRMWPGARRTEEIRLAPLGLLAARPRAVRSRPAEQPALTRRPPLGLAMGALGRAASPSTARTLAIRADAAGVLAEHVNAVEYRRLELSRCEDGRIVVRGLLDPVGGATLRIALAPLCARSGAGDQRPRARRLADGLVELAMHALDHGFATKPGRSARPPPAHRVGRYA